MSNTFTKQYQGGTSTTEKQINTALLTVKPTLANLDLSTTGSTSYDVLTSLGSLTTPTYESFNDVLLNSTITPATGNKLFNNVSVFSSTTANIISNARSRTINTTATAKNIALASEAQDIIPSITITTGGNPIMVALYGSAYKSNVYSTNPIPPPLNLGSDGDVLQVSFEILKDSNVIGTTRINLRSSSWGGTGAFNSPPFPPNRYPATVKIPFKFLVLDTSTAGTYTYTVQVTDLGSNTSPRFEVTLYAYEL